jgi:hypothetical protein
MDHYQDWSLQGLICDIKDHKSISSPWPEDMKTLYGFAATFNKRDQLIRCKISNDIIQTIRELKPWKEECYIEYSICYLQGKVYNESNIVTLHLYKKSFKKIHA